MTDGGRGVWFVRQGVGGGGAETLEACCGVSWAALGPAALERAPPPKSLSRRHGSDVEVGVPDGALIC